MFDIARLVRAVCMKEDEAYPPPRFKGRQKFLDFLNEAVAAETFEEMTIIAEKHQLETSHSRFKWLGQK